jgi:hypothetical protein
MLSLLAFAAGVWPAVERGNYAPESRSNRSMKIQGKMAHFGLAF